MIAPPLPKMLFWLLAAAVLFLALVPGPLGAIIPSDAERHYLAFLVLPAVAAYAWPRVPTLVMWLVFVAFGGAIELLQFAMRLGREADWGDWINDMTAITVSLVVCAMIFPRRRDRGDEMSDA